MKAKILLLSLFLCFPAAPFVHAGPSAPELTQMARDAESRGYLALAAHYYSHALKASPDLDTERALARVLKRAGYAALSEAQWRKVLESRPEDAEALKEVATLSTAAGRDKVAGARAHESVAVEVPKKSDVPLEKGMGVWVYGEPRGHVKTLNEYNLAAPRAQRFKYVFALAGTLGFRDGRATVAWELDRATIMADTLAGEGRVYPLIEGLSQGAPTLDKAEWERVAKEIGEKIQSEDRFAGVMLDIEPHMSGLHPLYALIKKYTNKPLGTALRVWDNITFQYVDFAVFQAYSPVMGPPPVTSMENNHATVTLGPHFATADEYFNRVRDNIRVFMRDARRQNGMAMVALPASATRNEFESLSKQPGAEQLYTKEKMATYFDKGRRAIGSALEQNDPSFLGVAVFALEPEGGLHGPYDKEWYFPSIVPKELWETFKLAVERP